MPTTPLVRWQALHLVKAGNDPSEYEDAFAADADRARFAVADGATEASFAARWARLLVEGFVAADCCPVAQSLDGSIRHGNAGRPRLIPCRCRGTPRINASRALLPHCWAWPSAPPGWTGRGSGARWRSATVASSTRGEAGCSVPFHSVIRRSSAAGRGCWARAAKGPNASARATGPVAGGGEEIASCWRLMPWPSGSSGSASRKRSPWTRSPRYLPSPIPGRRFPAGLKIAGTSKPCATMMLP